MQCVHNLSRLGGCAARKQEGEVKKVDVVGNSKTTNLKNETFRVKYEATAIKFPNPLVT